MKTEKRKYKRVKSNFGVKIDVDKVFEKSLSEISGQSIDVSANGVLFRYKKPLELGSTISIKFLKPNSFDFFQGNAKVVRIELIKENNEYDIGIQFLNLSFEDERKLNYCITKE
jgi:c-di-GMP-binding flagellar brake protein YcgR